jgi:hypothetical protein
MARLQSLGTRIKARFEPMNYTELIGLYGLSKTSNDAVGLCADMPDPTTIVEESSRPATRISTGPLIGHFELLT